jgi:hypothetical protein
VLHRRPKHFLWSLHESVSLKTINNLRHGSVAMVVTTQDRQCTYNVTLRRVHESLLPWESNKYHIFVCVCMRVRVCSLTYPACSAYAPYCDVICDFRLHQIFRHCLISGAIFGKTLLNIKCVFWFSLQSLSKTFLILKKNLARCWHKCENVVM